MLRRAWRSDFLCRLNALLGIVFWRISTLLDVQDSFKWEQAECGWFGTIESCMHCAPRTGDAS